MSEPKRILEKLEKVKYPLLMLLLGIGILLIPGRAARQSEASDVNQLLQQTLSCTQGVGEARVIVSENGVVVVCRGAENAAVRLDIIRAVGSYTGFASDKIIVLKMAE